MIVTWISEVYRNFLTIRSLKASFFYQMIKIQENKYSMITYLVYAHENSTPNRSLICNIRPTWY